MSLLRVLEGVGGESSRQQLKEENLAQRRGPSKLRNRERGGEFTQGTKEKTCLGIRRKQKKLYLEKKLQRDVTALRFGGRDKAIH